jgi:hypothetical protein
MEPSNRTDGRERQVTECIPIIGLARLNDDGRSREIRAIELLQSQPNHIELVTEKLTLRSLLSQYHADEHRSRYVLSAPKLILLAERT